MAWLKRSTRRRSWRRSGAADEAEPARLADINGGQWKQYTAVRTNVSGLGETTVPVFWEVAKEG